MDRLRASSVTMRRPVGPTAVDPVEARMENEVREILERRFGRRAVQAQKDYVDLRVINGSKSILIELKSSSDARTAIRQAIGQLLDYAFFKDGASRSELIVVGQGHLSSKAARFLAVLRRRFRIPLQYRRYLVGSMQFRL